RVTDRGAVERAGRAPDHDIGDDPAFEERTQHADLAHALVAATGEDERGPRLLEGAAGSGVLPCREGQPRPHTEYFGRFPCHLVKKHPPAPFSSPKFPVAHSSSVQKNPRVYSATTHQSGNGSARDRLLQAV